VKTIYVIIAAISILVKNRETMFIILKSISDPREVTTLGQLAVCINGHLLTFDSAQEAEEYTIEEDLPLEYEIVYVECK